MLFKNCEHCNELGTRVCGSENPPRFFCDSHASSHILSSGDHWIRAALEPLTPSQVSFIQETFNSYRLFSLYEAIRTKNSRIENLLLRIRKAEEECSSIIETILSGPITKDIKEVLSHQALPLFSDSSLVRSLLDLKHASNISCPPIQNLLVSLNSSLQCSFHSFFSTPASSTQTDPPSNPTFSTQTDPPSTISVQTSTPSLSTQLFSSQIDIAKAVDSKNYRWELFQQTKAHTDGARSIAISDCERYIASSGIDKTIKIWELQTLRLIHTLNGHNDNVYSVAFLGNKVVSGSKDKTIKIWEENRCIRTLNNHLGSVYSVCVSSGKRLIVAGSDNKTAVVFRLEDNEKLYSLPHSGNVYSVVFSKDDEEIVSGSSEGKIRIWNTETGDLLKILNAHSGTVRCVNYSEKFIVSSSDDRTVKIWDRENDEALCTFTDHAKEVYGIDVKDNIVASLGHDNKLIVRDIRSGTVFQILETNGTSGGTKIGLKLLKGGMFIVSGANDGNVNVWRRVT